MFREFEINNFTGIETSNRKPNKSACRECKNLDPRFINGDMTLRPGFVVKYTAIADADHRSKLSLTYLGFENFYSPEGSGQEITTWVTKGALTGESTGQTLGTPASINILAIFTSHKWTGTAWVGTNWNEVAGKSWLNHSVLTKIKTVNASRWKLELDFTDADIITAALFDKWTIANISKSPVQYQKVILTYDYDAGGGNANPGVEITSETHNWAAGDTVLLMKNYIPYEELTAMGHPSTGVTANQLNFHRVLNDLRISFGGYDNRIALMVGYRKLIQRLSSVDFYAYSANQIETFATTNGLILEPYNTYGMIASSNPSSVTGGTLPAGAYFFKLIATTDTFNKYLISENALGFSSGTFDIRLMPKINIGTLPKRLTSISVYWASGAYTDKVATSPYFLLKEWKISADTYEALDWRISNDGTLQLTESFPDNLHSSRNAISSNSNTVLTGSIDPTASTAVVGVGTLFTTELAVGDQILVSGETRTVTVITDDLNLTVSVAFTDNANDTSPERLAEANTTTGWTVLPSHNDITLASVTGTPSPHGSGNYSMKITHTNSDAFDCGAYYLANLEWNVNYKFNFWVYCSVAMDVTIWFVYGVTYWQRAKTIHIPAAAWTNIVETVNTNIAPFEYGSPTGFRITAHYASTEYFALDEMIINKSELYSDLNPTTALVDDDELTDNLGYQDTYDYVKSWDKAIITQGRTFVTGAYIDKRYPTLIFGSHISSAFMYDVITAGKYLDVEGKDDPVGIEVLPNLDIIVIKKNSVQYVDPDSGVSRGIYFVDGAISRQSIVNFGDKVVWCGENDIYASDGINVVPLTDGTIREDYRTLVSALGSETIIAIREERDNAYRCSLASLGVEYILTKKGWVKRVNANSVIPDSFVAARNGTVWFMDAGVIYYDYTGISYDNATSLTAEWKSIEFDCELIGEDITGSDFFYIDRVWMDFTIVDTVLLDMTVTLSIYLDGNSTAYKSFAETYTYSAPAVNFRKKIFRRFITTNARRFSIGIALTGTGVLGRTFELHSVGVMWKPGQRGWNDA